MPRGYDYGNARLRVMHSRLLTESDYYTLLGKTNIEELIAALAETPYKEDVEAALLRAEGVNCVYEAARANLIRVLLKVPQFYEGEPQELVKLLLRRWDRHNLLAILRGQSQELSAETVLAVTVPVGQLDQAALRELARQPGLRAVIELMTIWRLPYGEALRQVQARTGTLPDLEQLELALNRFHYASILAALADGNHNRSIAREYFQTEIDLVNLNTALRLVHLPDLKILLRRRYQSEDAGPLMIERGHLSPAWLTRLIAESGGLEEMVRELSSSRYGPALQEGWQRYQAGEGDLSLFERAFERWRAQQAVILYSHDPLSIAIPIAYLELKQVEIANLRFIAQAIVWGLKREQVQRELIAVSTGF